MHAECQTVPSCERGNPRKVVYRAPSKDDWLLALLELLTIDATPSIIVNGCKGI